MKKFRNLYKVRRYLAIIAGNLLITGAYAFLTVPNKIVNGGVTSFSMILGEVTSINLTYLVDFITLLLLLLCYLFLAFRSTGIQFLVHPAIGMVLAGILVGLGYALCIRAESTAVGFDVLALILNKKNPKLNVALCMCVINMCVLLFGLFTYGILSVLTGIGFTALQSLTLNHFLRKTV